MGLAHRLCSQDFVDNTDDPLRSKSRVSSSSGTPYEIGSSERGFNDEADLTERTIEIGSSGRGLDDQADMTERTAQLSLPIRLLRPRLDENVLDDATEPMLAPEDSYQSQSHMDLDGASDTSLNQQKSGYDSRGYMDKNTSSAALPKTVSEQGVRQPSLLEESSGHSTPPALSLSRSPTTIARRSSNFPQSSLYISRAVNASSPEKRAQALLLGSDFEAESPTSSEKRHRSRTPSDDSSSDTSGLFSQPLRRRKKYRSGTKRSSRDSEALSPEVGGPYISPAVNRCRNEKTYIPTRAPSELITASYGPTVESSPNPASNYSSPRLIQAASFLIESSPAGYSSLNSGRASRRLFPSSAATTSPLRSDAFSASYRTSPFDRPLPNTPPSPHLSPPPSPPPSSTQQLSTLSSHSPTPVRLPVYNDNLPASSQPQTPANISRRRRHPPYMTNPFGHGLAYTAPVGREQDAVSRWRNFSGQTPTRRPRIHHGMINQDQENLTTGIEALRIWEAQFGRNEPETDER